MNENTSYRHEGDREIVYLLKMSISSFISKICIIDSIKDNIC